MCFYRLVSFFIVLVLSCPLTQAQTPSDRPRSDNQFQYANFTPSLAIIIVILIAALLCMGFFSIYIRNCSQSATGSGSVRPPRRRAVEASGLDAAVIETFPTFTYAEVKDHHFGKEALECAVCLNEFEDLETLRLIPKCDHVFHPDCINAWLERHVTCPVCRADLSPKPDDPPVQVNIQHQNEDVTRQVQQQEEEASDVNRQQEEGSNKLGVTRNFSINIRNWPSGSGVNRNWRSGSLYMKRPGMLSKFRSNSTGHSVMVVGENLDRYTLKLPEEVRREVMTRAWLNRTKSCAVALTSDSGWRRTGEGSSRGGARSYRRIERGEQLAKSDRWVFTLFSRGPSMKPDGDGSTSRGVRTPVKMPSFKCLEPKGDEDCLVSADSARLPV